MRITPEQLPPAQPTAQWPPADQPAAPGQAPAWTATPQPGAGQRPPWLPPPDARGSGGPPRQRNPLGFGRLLAVGLLAVALVAAGVGIGELRSSANGSNDQAGIPPSAAQQGPVQVKDTTGEPVEAVA